MKKMKRLVALALSVVMVLAMSVMAFADDNHTPTYTITINNATKGHSYEAYQIFSGKLSGGKLTDIAWGNGVTSFNYAGKTTAEEITKSLSDSNAKDFAKVAVNYLDSVSGSYSYDETSNTGKITGLSAGYYLVKDTMNDEVVQPTAYTSYILQVAGNVAVSPKTGVPTVEKKVKENVKKINESGEDQDKRIPTYKIPDHYNDVADYNIRDNVPFQLIGTMPSNIDSYDHYYYEFADTLSKGLTYNKDAVVKIDGVEIEASSINDSVNSDSEITSLNVILMDLKSIVNEKNKTLGDDKKINLTKDSIITVDYTATLNNNAEIGLPGNTNEVKLIFSNNPNNTGNGTSKPGNTGETPEDKVIVFTYELDTEKIDGTDNTKKLSGAKFKLLNSDRSKGASVENGKFAGWVEKDNATELETSANGLIKIAGLDAGTYYLEETKAPEGYNKLTGHVEVVITATTANGQQWEGTDNQTPDNALTDLGVQSKNKNDQDYANGSADKKTGIAKVQIANNAGSSLPSTGGIGTTIFYIIGGILMVGAAILLITKRRAEN